MRVLMHTRPDWRELPGGDYVQLKRWAFWLNALGVRTEVTDAVEPNLGGVDLVHLNNLGRASALLPTVRHCHKFGVPVLLTTLYWPPHEYECYGRPGAAGRVWRWLPVGVRDRVKTAVRCWQKPRFLKKPGFWQELWHGSQLLARKVAESVDGLIAVSSAEVDALEQFLPDAPPIYVVKSGVDAVYWSSDRKLWAREQGEVETRFLEETGFPDDPTEARDGVLCVARFDPQKGQHRLIETLRPLQVPLTLIGSDNPNYPGYRRLCQELAGRDTTILPRQTLGRLRWHFHHCRVHAVVSWFELSGLSALEAGACGARVVTTARGGMRDYCGDLAWYADPADLSSIRRAVAEALAAPETPRLAEHVRKHYTWEQSARRLYEVYGTLLASQRRLAA